MNRVQFQSGLSMAEFMKRYGTDEQCEAALVGSRWPARNKPVENEERVRGFAWRLSSELVNSVQRTPLDAGCSRVRKDWEVPPTRLPQDVQPLDLSSTDGVPKTRESSGPTVSTSEAVPTFLPVSHLRSSKCSAGIRHRWPRCQDCLYEAFSVLAAVLSASAIDLHDLRTSRLYTLAK